LPEHAPARPFARVLLALIAGQIGIHSTMAGVRLAAPLQALRDGHSALSVGLLLALYAAAPVLLSLHAGRLADRLGYHRPVRVAIGLALCGAALAVSSTFVADGVGLRCGSAVFVGSGANLGLIAVQRKAGLSARDNTERVRVFSWLGIAPSLSNVIGPVSAGFLIDAGGFRAAYALMLLLPLLSWWFVRYVPVEGLPRRSVGAAPRGSWDLLRTPGLKRLLAINWLLSACWDVHAFAVPILGFERGYSASTIGLILGSFTLSISAVRLLIPLFAHRLHEAAVLRIAMLATGVVFALYPLAGSPWWMVGCALVLGLTLGSVQPMIMSTLHQLTPDGRHGEAIAFRSMVMNASSTAMPLLFGVAGATLGAAALFWLVGGAVAAGSWLARQLPAAPAG
jgi:MFS family permease